MTELTAVWSYLGVELRQLLFIQVSLSVDTSFIAELKHNRSKQREHVISFVFVVCFDCITKCTQNKYNNANYQRHFSWICHTVSEQQTTLHQIYFSWEKKHERDREEDMAERHFESFNNHDMKWRYQISLCIRLSSIPSVRLVIISTYYILPEKPSTAPWSFSINLQEGLCIQVWQIKKDKSIEAV